VNDLMPTAATLPPLRRIDAGGRMVAYREAGQGPALVLLHGIGSGSASWRSQFHSFSRRFRVIAWDAPGYGGSDALAIGSPTAGDYAGALDVFAAAQGLNRVYLIGHSLGALIAASFARAHPDRVAALVLANPATGYGAAADDVRRARVDSRLEDLERLGPAGLAAKRAQGLLSPRAKPEALAMVREVMGQIRPDGYAQAVRMLGGANLLAVAPEIKAPTLVLGASNDKVTPEDGCRRIAAAVPGARYVSLTGPGHASYVEDPTAFDTQVLLFLGAHA
jgi:pimeloyl-ACP methyl ester carboxylesterase